MASSFGSLKSSIFERQERKQQYQAHILGLNAYDRHKQFINDYVNYYGEERSSLTKLPIRTDQDTLKDGYRFIRSEEDDMDTSWEQRLVKRYYDKLFKEYCIADMTHYKTGKIGLRWRTEKEVIAGKGQFICGNKHCDKKDGLASYEVNFSYMEAGEHKQALVKLVACERCSDKLNYKRRKEKEKMEREEEYHRRKRDRSKGDDNADDKPRNRDREVYKRKRDTSSDDESDHSTHEDKYERKKGALSLLLSIVASYLMIHLRPNPPSISQLPNSNEISEGVKHSVSSDKHLAGEDENFDEFLEGMFP